MSNQQIESSLSSRIDHLVYGVPDLQEGIRLIGKQLGIVPVTGGRHLGFGTHNALLKIGKQTYLEVIAPDPEQGWHEGPLWMGLHEIREPALIWWAAKAALPQGLEPAIQQGWKPGNVLAGSRVLPNRNTLNWRLTDPYLVQEKGILPFLIDWGNGPHPTDTLPISGCNLTEFRLSHPEPEKIHTYLAALEIDIPVHYRHQAGIQAGLTTPLGLVYLT